MYLIFIDFSKVIQKLNYDKKKDAVHYWMVNKNGDQRATDDRKNGDHKNYDQRNDDFKHDNHKDYWRQKMDD